MNEKLWSWRLSYLSFFDLSHQYPLYSKSIQQKFNQTLWVKNSYNKWIEGDLIERTKNGVKWLAILFFCYTKHCHRIGNCIEALIIHGQINRWKRGKDNRAYFWILFDSSTTPARNSQCNVADTPPFDCPLLLILREQKCMIKKKQVRFPLRSFFSFVGVWIKAIIFLSYRYFWVPTCTPVAPMGGKYSQQIYCPRRASFEKNNSLLFFPFNFYNLSNVTTASTPRFNYW